MKTVIERHTLKKRKSIEVKKETSSSDLDKLALILANSIVKSVKDDVNLKDNIKINDIPLKNMDDERKQKLIEDEIVTILAENMVHKEEAVSIFNNVYNCVNSDQYYSLVADKSKSYSYSRIRETKSYTAFLDDLAHTVIELMKHGGKKKNFFDFFQELNQVQDIDSDSIDNNAD